VLIRIRRVVEPPPADPEPLEHDERNWPILPGTAWERHDDPDVTQ
jgi:hypothetical protein